MNFLLLYNNFNSFDRFSLLRASASLVLILGWGDIFLAASRLHWHICRLLLHILQLNFLDELAILFVQRIHVSLRANTTRVAAEDEAEKTHAAAAFLGCSDSFATWQQPDVLLVGESTVITFSSSLVRDVCSLRR